MLKETHERQLESSWIWKKIRVWSTLKGIRDYFQSTTMQEENWLRRSDIFGRNCWDRATICSNKICCWRIICQSWAQSNHQARSRVGLDIVLWSWYCVLVFAPIWWNVQLSYKSVWEHSEERTPGLLCNPHDFGFWLRSLVNFLFFLDSRPTIKS